jgi:CBS domain-containing protein
MTDAFEKPAQRGAAPVCIHECMTSAPITIGADDSCADAMRVMEASKIRHLPVLDAQRLVGILTRGDIYRRSPVHPECQDDGALQLSSVSVAGVMTYAPRTAPPSATLLDAVKMMRAQTKSTIPYVKY